MSSLYFLLPLHGIISWSIKTKATLRARASQIPRRDLQVISDTCRIIVTTYMQELAVPSVYFMKWYRGRCKKKNNKMICWLFIRAIKMHIKILKIGNASYFHTRMRYEKKSILMFNCLQESKIYCGNTVKKVYMLTMIKKYIFLRSFPSMILHCICICISWMMLGTHFRDHI